MISAGAVLYQYLFTMAKLPLVINSVDKTKYLFPLLHRRSTAVSLGNNNYLFFFNYSYASCLISKYV